MNLPLKRVFIDIPTNVHDDLKILAVQRGMSQKGLVAELIIQACATKPARKKAKKKVTKKRRKKTRSRK